MKIIVIIIFLYSCLTFSQEKKIEEIYQECTYRVLDDNGIAFKEKIKIYEDYLIKIKILDDGSAKGYYDLFKSFSKNNIDLSTVGYSFIDSINDVESKIIFSQENSCSLEINKHKDFENYKEKIKLAIPRSNTNLKKGLKRLSKILKVDDFALDYYKLRVFILLDMFDFIK
jgi:hypothetical protein